MAINEYYNHPILLACSTFNALSFAGFNYTGIMITQYASAAQRSTIDVCRALLVWAFFLALGKEKFIPGQLVGFVILVFGTLVYNEIIEVPFDFMNYMTKRNI